MGSHELGVRFNCYTPAYSSNCMDSHRDRRGSGGIIKSVHFGNLENFL